MIQQNYISLHIKIQHEIPFGKAIYILGNCQQLGNWKPSIKTRLIWSEGNNWRKSLILPRNVQVQYKYTIASFNDPAQYEIEWQIGQNRLLDLFRIIENQTYLIEKWNTLRLKIQLFTDPNQDISQVYIVGNCPDLGMKVTRRKMIEGKEDQNPEKKFWNISFDFSKYKNYLNYYYFTTIGGRIQKIRQPGKFYYTNSQNDQNFLSRIDIENSPGQIIIRQKQNFKGFRITYLCKNIFIGPYVKNIEDLKVLKQSGVKATLSLQSEEDMNKYQLNWQHIKQQASEFGISAYNLQITDMNFIDFTKKSVEALILLRKLIKMHEIVYVHCTAGIFRSPHLFQNYSLNDAIKLVRDKRPFVYLCVQGMRNMMNGVILASENKKNQIIQFFKNIRQY